ncbi:DEAD/DEAH box helicase [Acuticoccus sp. MNP-M23]|uniref:DEAD/DEAH box helicase n=1 Tax=Acuticoccus sp. MNP-M23 TaxID=3072793 RepID=UPI00281685D8|nr:DEAD/DEAH box helicase [Acuticoccus sp. MNP-M23]WMS42306.1 DEAD/DEAH box helicase [Acuticoccus sp. MNP-M23]
MFKDLGLSPKVLSAVEAAGYSQPTPIQAEAIPHALEKRDVLGLAQTGTGKTASFVLPMLSLLERGRARARMPRTLILEPTRELAAQVAESFEKYGANHKLTVALLIGGVSFGDQNRKIDRGADVVIATPGRLMDHMERGKLLLQQIEILVVDEADRMLDMGFIPDIEKICKQLPVTRQTLFFSATMPKEIQSLVDRFLHNPVRVEVSKTSSAAETVEQAFVKSGSAASEKRETLRRLLKAETELTNGIIFCNRKRDIGTLFRSLERHGFSVGALHGDMDQRSRMATLDGFKKNQITLLVASDVAARGLDIPEVSHVFNYDVPHNSEDYVHRIGRTGRAGRSGKAFTIAAPKEDAKLIAGIEEMLSLKVPWLDEPEDVAAAAVPAPASSETPAREERAKRPPRTRSRKRTAETETVEAAPEAEAPAAAPAETPAEASAPEPSPKPKTQGRGRRKPEAPKEQPVEQARPQPQAQAEPAQKSDTNRNSRRGNRRQDDDGDSRVPFEKTPYVPAFLLRPFHVRRDSGKDTAE